MKRMGEISMFFTSLIAQSIDLPADAFDAFFDKDQQHKLKIVKYPDTGTGVGQGVGPHKDSMLSSYLLQASDHRGLQAQNTKGEWIDCTSPSNPPLSPIRKTGFISAGNGIQLTMTKNHRSPQKRYPCRRSRPRPRSTHIGSLRQHDPSRPQSRSRFRPSLQHPLLPRRIIRCQIRIHACARTRPSAQERPPGSAEWAEER